MALMTTTDRSACRVSHPACLPYESDYRCRTALALPVQQPYQPDLSHRLVPHRPDLFYPSDLSHRPHRPYRPYQPHQPHQPMLPDQPHVSEPHRRQNPKVRY